jgi:hypothetical protein
MRIGTEEQKIGNCVEQSNLCRAREAGSRDITGIGKEDKLFSLSILISYPLDLWSSNWGTRKHLTGYVKTEKKFL